VSAVTHRGRILALLLLLAALPAAAGLGDLRGLVRKPAGSGSDPVAWLDRVERTLEQSEEAGRRLDESRAALFALGASAEERALLAEMQARKDSASTDAQRDEAVAAMRTYQDETVRKAREEGRYARRELDARQRKNLGALLGNLALATLNERQALANGNLLITESKDALAGAGQPRYAPQLLRRRKQLAAAPERLGALVRSVPANLVALGNLLDAAQQLRRANEVPEPLPPAEDAPYEPLEEF